MKSQRSKTHIFFIAAAMVGIALGAGGYTFYYADGFSYLSNDPAVCANCHVMRGHYESWIKSSHHAVATCNDCHTPHNFIGKYRSKAENGFHHSKAFTLGNFHEPIRITEKNRQITEAACRHCHSDITHAIDITSGSSQEISCIRCHSRTGHR